LRADTSWTAARIDEAMSAGVERHVRLGRPVPVSIMYLTAWVDDNGRIQFRDDIYQKDERLMEMIFSKK
jgi:murein L,D-transpeptidase YcbB/YkuD